MTYSLLYVRFTCVPGDFAPPLCLGCDTNDEWHGVAFQAALKVSEAKAAAAEQKSTRLEAELAAQERSFRAAAEEAEGRWVKRLESMERQMSEASERMSRDEEVKGGQGDSDRRLEGLENELRRCRERARALLEEKDREITALKVATPCRPSHSFLSLRFRPHP